MHCIKPGSVRWFWASFTSSHVLEERSGCGHLLWPWMHLKNFLRQRKWRWRFTASCLTCQTSSVTTDIVKLLNTTHLKEVSGWWLCSYEGTVLSVSYLLHAGNSARNILSVGPTPPAASPSEQEGGDPVVLLGEETHAPLVRQPDIVSEWDHVISCSASSLPDHCDHTGYCHVHVAICTKRFPRYLSSGWQNWMWDESATVLWVLAAVQSAWLVVGS